MFTTKQQRYTKIVRDYEDMYGALPSDENETPTMFVVTGPFRKYIHDQMDNVEFNLGLLVAVLAMFMLAPNWMSITFTIVSSLIYIDMSQNLFDGEILDINGRKIGVAIPSQEEEGDGEARNFKETNDEKKLNEALERAGLKSNTMTKTVASIGSATTQFIFGQKNVKQTEIDIGIDNSLDEEIDELLNNQTEGIMCIMNSAAYAIKEDAGIVYNDNVSGTDTISENIVERMIGGTGNNKKAMAFTEKVVRRHKELNKDYILVFIPRGDKTMPQGGSHAKQRIVDKIRETSGRRMRVIEVSGKQTKVFEIDEKEDDYELDNYHTEKLCKLIKEKKITTSEGKTYGSADVFKTKKRM
jgi:hypothetical protein